MKVLETIAYPKFHGDENDHDDGDDDDHDDGDDDDDDFKILKTGEARRTNRRGEVVGGLPVEGHQSGITALLYN